MDTLLFIKTKMVLFYLHLVIQKGFLTKRYDEPFVVIGFCNWKKALERFQ